MAEEVMDTVGQPAKRKFLKGLIAVLGIATIAGIIYPFVRYLQPRTREESIGGVEVPEANILPGKALLITYRGSPAFVINTDAGYVALSAVCTHLGCIVKWQEEESILFCPCHAGKFDTSGNVLAGPPPKPLERFPVKVAAGKIIVGGA